MSRDPVLKLDLQSIDDDEPCPAVVACHELYSLGLGDNEVQVAWPKLAGRPVGRVEALLANIKSARRESWQHHLSEFGKKVKTVKEAS